MEQVEPDPRAQRRVQREKAPRVEPGRVVQQSVEPPRVEPPRASVPDLTPESAQNPYLVQRHQTRLRNLAVMRELGL